ncbi:MAG: ComEC/Rec2 family competence protein [Blastocatellia bacterium]
MPRRLSFTRLRLPEQPLLFSAIAFLCGLLLAAYFHVSIRIWLGATIIAWIAAGAGLLWSGRDLSITACLLVGCFAGGGALWELNEASVANDRIRRMFERGELSVEEPVELVGTIEAAPELAPDRIYLRLSVESLSSLNRERPASGVVQITVPFHDDESRVEYDSLAIDYGSRIRLLGFLTNGRGYRNPGAPDFDEMLEHRGFDATGWVKSPLLIEKLSEGKRNAVLQWLYRIRSRALAVTLRGFKQPTSGILAAALFGNRRFLSRDAAESFRAGGTFHLLVISGLHVAMIALVALWLARRLIRSRIVQYALVIMLLWAYALMVGAQPSITRAAVMLSIAMIGQLIFRGAAGANTLAAGAVVLLVWQPRDLFNPAFQLSFLTVLMIVGLTAPLYLRLKMIGEWRPSAATPYPPRAPAGVKWLAEVLFWDERGFRAEMRESHIRYRLEKAGFAIWLNRFRLQQPAVWIAATLFTTIGVQTGLLPLMVLHFHRFSIVSPVANVVESFLIFVLMVAGAVVLLLHSLIGAWALKLAGIVNAVGWATVRSGDWLIAWRNASFRVPDWGDGWQWIFAAFFAGVLALILCANEWNPFRKGDEAADARRRVTGRAVASVSALMIAVIGVLLIAHPFKHKYERGRLSVTFLDVGQGDAMLVRFPQGKLMMLDSGGRAAFTSSDEFDGDEEVFVEDRIGVAEAAVMPFLWHLGIKRLDWMTGSHADADHVEAFSEVARDFAIGGAMRGVSMKAGPDFFDRAVLIARAPLRRVKRGDTLDVDGARMEILSPDTGVPPMSDNNESLVMRLTLGRRSFLLTGDIEKETELRLAESAGDPRADVLKVAHHGSKTSSMVEFLQRVNPQHAVISVASPSPYGHPHAEALQRLQTTGAHIWRTSHCGAITISTDGDDLRVETTVKCESDGQSGGSASRSSPAR